MTAVKSSLPSAKMPLIDLSTGRVNDPWYLYFQAEHTRTGGDKADKVDIAAQGGTAAGTAAAAAQASANAAAASLATQVALQAVQISGVDDAMTIVSHDSGAAVTVTMSAHTRYYGDGTSVAVSGGSIGSLPYATEQFIYYDDPTRAGGAVTYIAATSSANALPTPTHPNRHYVGSAVAINALDPDADGNPNYWSLR